MECCCKMHISRSVGSASSVNVPGEQRHTLERLGKYAAVMSFAEGDVILAEGIVGVEKPPRSKHRAEC